MQDTFQLAPAHMQPDPSAEPIEVVCMTPKRVAATLGVSTSTIQRLIERGILPHYFIAGECVVMSDDLDTFIDGLRPLRVE